ncbi:MAG: DUF6465 family protein [Bilifractor sp.]
MASKKNEVKTDVILQYAGKQFTQADIIARVKTAAPAAKDLTIYVKPEENRAYYVADGDADNYVDL